MNSELRPPRLVRRALRFFLPSDVRDPIDGDLAELHAAHRKSHGSLWATAWYCKEALSISTQFFIHSITRAPALPKSLLGAVSGIDFRLSVRLLLKNPGLTLISGFGIAVAIGLTTGVFAFLNLNLSPTLPLQEGERIVALENWNVPLNNEARRSSRDFVTWREQMKSVVEISAFRKIYAVLETGPASAEDITIAGMTASGFRVARVQPLLGRVVDAHDEISGAPPVLIIGYDVWRTRFAADSSVIGREARIDDRLYTIIGVMPAGYGFPLNNEYWTTLQLDLRNVARGSGPELYVFGRLATGATMASARAELAVIGQQTALAFPNTNGDLRPKVWRYTDPLLDIQGMSWSSVWLAQLTIVLTVIIVALNVAILVYARTTVRRSEIAVRTALGASRRRIVSQLFVEAIVLSLPPALLGLALTQYALKLAGRGMVVGQSSLGGRLPFWTDLSIQPRIAFLALGLALVVAVIVGVLPALQATGSRIEKDLRQLSGATGLKLGKMWTVLVVAQVAFAVAILPPALKNGLQASTAAFTRTTYREQDFTSALLTAKRTALSPTQPTPELGSRLDDVVRTIKSNPSVIGVTFRGGAPTGGMWSGRIEVAGTKVPNDIQSRVGAQGVDTGFFNVYGARLLNGRQFASGDLGDSVRSVIVNHAFVHRVLGDKNAIGTRVRYVPQRLADTVATPLWFEVVGVVEDLRKNSLDPDAISPLIYHPFAPGRASAVRMLVRTRDILDAATGTMLHKSVAAISSELRLSQLKAGSTVDPEAEFILELLGKVLTLVLATVLLLSAAGIYALMSFTVAQRRREIGIRTALGASRHSVMITIFSRAARQIGLGVVVGAIIAAILDRITGPVAAAPTVFLVPIVALIMVLVGFCAAYAPTRRGLAIQPVEALRSE